MEIRCYLFYIYICYIYAVVKMKERKRGGQVLLLIYICYLFYYLFLF